MTAGAGERARELAALIEEHMPLESAAGEPGDCGCSCMERFTTEYTWKGYCEHLARKLAVALAAVRLEARQEIIEQVRNLKRMAEKCDREGLAETPQREWTPYQGKILAYDCVLAILAERAVEGK